MRLDLAISLRYIRSRRGENALSLITWIAVAGVTLGVAALVVAMSVMNGYRANLVQAMAGALPHVSLHALLTGALPPLDELRPVLEARFQPETISAYILHETLLAGPRAGGATSGAAGGAAVGARGAVSGPAAAAPAAATGAGVQGVLIRAIDPAVERRVAGLLAFVDDGSDGWGALPPAERSARAAALLQRLSEAPAPGVAPVLLSRLLAGRLGARLGDDLVPLRFPRADEGFSPYPTATRLRLIGYFETDIAAFDELVVVMDVERIAAVFPDAALTRSIGMRLRDPLQASAAAEWLRGEMLRQERSAYVYSWLESNRGLFQVIRVQKTMLFLVLLLIVLLAFFGMLSALVMLVAEKTREITILKSLGAQGRMIYRVFLLQGVFIGLVGTALGLALGLAVCWVLATFPLFEIPPGVYPGSDRVPVLVVPLDLVLVVAATLLICLLATVFPARKAIALRPAEGLRFS